MIKNYINFIKVPYMMFYYNSLKFSVPWLQSLSLITTDESQQNVLFFSLYDHKINCTFVNDLRLQSTQIASSFEFLQ